MSNYYRVLGVQKNATANDIKKAYRMKALAYHPDRNNDAPEAIERFRIVNEAYAVLGNIAKRSVYDQMGEEEFSKNFSVDDIFQDFDITDILRGFEEFFRSGDFSHTSGSSRRFKDFADPFRQMYEEARSGADQGRDRSLDIEHVFPVGFEEAAYGAVKAFTYIRDGRETQIDIAIPQGVAAGKKLRLAGQGNSSLTGGRPGDLYFKIYVQDHPIFIRDGNDVTLNHEINMTEAALGTIITVPTLKGDQRVRVPPRTQSHSTLRLKGFGIPHADGTGDQLVRIIIKYPKELSEWQEDLLEQLQRTGI